jgi:hypothetical protein
MTGPEESTRARQRDNPDAVGQLAAVVAARDAWVAEATAMLQADREVVGVILVGSLARGDGDAWSDVDLIVALDSPISRTLLADPFAGLGLPGVVLYRRPKPRNVIRTSEDHRSTSARRCIRCCRRTGSRMSNSDAGRFSPGALTHTPQVRQPHILKPGRSTDDGSSHVPGSADLSWRCQQISHGDK